MSTATLLPPGFDLADDVTDSLPTDTAPHACKEPGCSNGVVKPARGRMPSYCPEHKRTDSRARNTSKSRVSNKSWSRAAEIEELLNQMLGYTILPVFMFNQTDATILSQNGPKVLHELIELAKDDKNLQRVLETLATPGKYGPLTIAILGMVYPLAVNHKFIPDFTGMFSSDSEGGD